jgi:Family of unknown function (DUF6502)
VWDSGCFQSIPVSLLGIACRGSARIGQTRSPLRLKSTKADQGTEGSLLELLLPIARLLISDGTGIDTLVHAAKRAYVRAAVENVLPDGHRINISRLSVATGMTRKEVSTLLKGSRDKDHRNVDSRRRGEQRALRVLRGWSSDPRFHSRSGRPGSLQYRGSTQSFTHLVKLYGGDVTPKAVQRELERMGLIELTRGGGLRLRATRKSTSIEAYQISDLARLFEDFAFAVMRPKPDSESPSFFGFKDSTVPSAGDAAFFMNRFSRRAAAPLEDFEEWSAGRESAPKASRKTGRVRVGLGVYLLRPRHLAAASSGATRRNRPDRAALRKPRK